MFPCCSSLTKSCKSPMDCSPPGSSVDWIFQARILELVAISFSRGSSQIRGQTHISCFGRQTVYHWATREAPCVSQSVKSFVLVLWKNAAGNLIEIAEKVLFVGNTEKFLSRNNKYWAMKRNIYFGFILRLKSKPIKSSWKTQTCSSQLIGQWLRMCYWVFGKEKVLKDWWWWIRHLSVQPRKNLQGKSKLEDRKSSQDGSTETKAAAIIFLCFLLKTEPSQDWLACGFWRIWKCCPWKRPRNFFSPVDEANNL